MVIRLALVLAAFVAVNGCDNAIELPPSLRGTYTLWGALDPTTDLQSVRVVPVRDTLGLDTAAPLPVTVVSVEVATGVETAWRDSVVTFRNGSVGHVYRAALRPAYGSRHRFVVRRDADGGEVTAETTVPPQVVPAVQPTNLDGGVRVPVLWAGAPQLAPVRVTYYVQKYNALVAGGYERDRPLCELDTVSFMLPATPGRVGPDWITTLSFFDIQQLLDDTLAETPPGTYVIPPGGPTDRRFQIGLRKIRIATEVLSEDWRPPGGVFDFEALAAPEVFGNVEGGFGFVGAGYAAEVTFQPGRSDLNRAGFFNTRPLCPRVADDPPIEIP